MKAVNKKGLGAALIFGGLSLIGGIAYILFFVAISFFDSDVDKDVMTKSTDAVVIVDLEEEDNEYGGVDYDRIAYAEYTVDGKTYRKAVDDYEYKDGQEITIYYSPKNPRIAAPANIHFDETLKDIVKVLAVIISAIIIGLIVSGIIVLRSGIKQAKAEKAQQNKFIQ